MCTAFWSFKLLDSGKGEIPKSDRAEIGAALNLIQRGVAVWPIHRARSLRDGSSRPKNPCADKPASSNIRLLCSASGPLFCLVLRDEPVHLFLDFSSAPHHTSWLQIAARCVRGLLNLIWLPPLSFYLAARDVAPTGFYRDRAKREKTRQKEFSSEHLFGIATKRCSQKS